MHSFPSALPLSRVGAMPKTSLVREKALRNEKLALRAKKTTLRTILPPRWPGKVLAIYIQQTRGSKSPHGDEGRPGLQASTPASSHRPKNNHQNLSAEEAIIIILVTV
eukprot:TRINITY_DN220_c0_g1_i1.p1 TRINITY_DN220_c0_g1~~TRINITY_DN220_c0_g1_i1.p1  ORF type:complete len:108 (+),score=8.32 TRINITY_DN220_c0_g1_i1:89-412(+)